MVDPPSQPRRVTVFSWPAFASSSALHIFRFDGSRQANHHVTRRAKDRLRKTYAVAGAQRPQSDVHPKTGPTSDRDVYVLSLRDFEILYARDVKLHECARLIFLAAYSASGHSSPWMPADSPRKVSIGPQSLR